MAAAAGAPIPTLKAVRNGAADSMDRPTAVAPGTQHGGCHRGAVRRAAALISDRPTPSFLCCIARPRPYRAPALAELAQFRFRQRDGGGGDILFQITRRLVPGIGTMSGPWCSSHASAICPGVAPFEAATSRTTAASAMLASKLAPCSAGRCDGSRFPDISRRAGRCRSESRGPAGRTAPGRCRVRAAAG